MSKSEILEWFTVNNATLNGTKIAILMLIGILVGGLIYLTYQATYSGVSYSARFNASNVVILLITIVIMLMISSNIVISLGMVGALSIIRFRTAIKDPRDTVYIFWSIVEGLCIGSQNLKLAFISGVIIALVLVFFSFGMKAKGSYLLIIRGNEVKISEKELEEMLLKYMLKFQLKSLNRTDYSTELIYEVRAKGKLDLTIAESLKSIEGICTVNWLLETGETVG